MDNRLLIGRVFENSTDAKRLPSDDWEITCSITETLTFMDGTEKHETIEATCVDGDFDVAHQIALASVIGELGSLVYDRGFDSLVEGKEHQRALEAKNDHPKADEDTPIQ